MYSLSNFEFRQYEEAERKLQELKLKHSIELQMAYDNIRPTISAFDYDTGFIYSESINPEKYAIYLIELREEHTQQEKWWELRAFVFSEAYGMLTDKEKWCLSNREYGNYQERQKAWNKLKEIVAEIIETRPELQRKPVLTDTIEEMEEADQKIEKMSKKELLKDYWDLDELLFGERMKKQCISLYEIYDWPISMIAKKLGIQVAKVKEYIKSIPSKETKTNLETEIIAVSQKRQTGQGNDHDLNPKQRLFNSVTTSYLSPEELEQYRNGKKGGSKWCSYDDYLQMKKDGMSHKEIALKLRIEPSLLSKRIRAWKSKGFKNKSVWF